MKRSFDWINLENLKHDINDSFDENDFEDYFYKNLERFTEEFKKRFDYVVLYHCCRPININSYYDKGMLITKPEILIKDYINYFNKTYNIELDETEILLKAKQIGYYTENELYAVLDYRDSLNHGGNHYLYFGSEFLYCLFKEIYHPNIGLLKNKLKNIGKPTIFQLRIPLESINPEELQYIIRNYIESIMYNERGYLIECSILFDKDINSDYIVKHFHPNDDDLESCMIN